MELVLLGRLFGECRSLFFGLSLFLRKGHPFANYFSARLVVVHARDSLGLFYSVIAGVRASPTAASPLMRGERRSFVLDRGLLGHRCCGCRGFVPLDRL